MTDRVDLRPLGQFSDFVVEQMPSYLNAVQNDQLSIGRVTEVGMGLLPQRVLSRVPNLDLATLDLKMFERGLVRFGEQPPQKLVSLVDEASGLVNQPPGVTYEEIILINPGDDIRTFTSGAVGETEATFYRTHAKIEGSLGAVIASVTRAIEGLNKEQMDPVAAGGRIQDSADNLARVIEHTYSVGAQSRVHFDEFRSYLITHPIRGLKGPSGAFTARVPALEILLAGEKLPEDYLKYLEENRSYFPRDGRILLDQARHLANQGLSLTSLAEKLGKPDGLMNPAIQLSHFLREFRGAHYQAVRNQVPGAVTGEVSGTAGETNAGVFLRNRMKIKHI